MTVAELIEKLRSFPGDHRVVVPGWELGVDDVEDPVEIRIKVGADDESWNGPYIVSEPGGAHAVLIADKRNGRRAYIK